MNEIGKSLPFVAFWIFMAIASYSLFGALDNNCQPETAQEESND